MSERVENETDLIQTYLAPLAAGYPGAFGLKDDAAVLTLPERHELVVSTDPVIEGIHFFARDRADDIAWKALAVNLSDIAAKGAVPLGYTMALAFPSPPERQWMAQFASGLREAQVAFGCTLVGGDTDHTTGPLSISITAFGIVPAGRTVRRTSARIGDVLFVTGTLGDGALGLALHSDQNLYAEDLARGDRALLVARYLRPHPRVALAPILQDYATAALDISDGFAKDLARLVEGAGGGAAIEFASLPLSPPARRMIQCDERWAEAVVNGGDDYEILFSAPPESREGLLAACEAARIQVSQIGRICTASGVTVRTQTGIAMATRSAGYDHFTVR